MCVHGGLNPILAIKAKYIPVNVYNQMKNMFIQNCKYKSLLGLYPGEDIPNFTTYDKSKRNIKCDVCKKLLCNDTSKK